MNRGRKVAAPAPPPPLPVRGRGFGMASRPRAPSPPVRDNGKCGSSEDDSGSLDSSDNTYSVVQDSMLGSPSRPPPMPPKTKIMNSSKKSSNNRMFGDSVNPSPASSVTGSSSSSSGGSSPTTTGLYTKRAQTQRRTTAALLGKGVGSGSMSKFDADTVEDIKAQFQRQIESMLHSQETNSRNNTIAAAVPAVPAVTPKLPTGRAGVRTSHLQSHREKELDDLQRGKSFVEARTAVQKQIERMFSEAAVGDPVPGGGHPKSKDTLGIKHTMHGVSHQLLEDGSSDIKPPPPPMHYGIRAAIKQISINNDGRGDTSERVSNNKWQSVESLSAAAGRQPAAAAERSAAEPFVQERPPPKPSKFRSMENVSRSAGGGLTRTLVDVHSADINDPEVSDRLRKFKMEKGKSTPNLSSASNPGSNSSAASSASSSHSSAASSASTFNHSSVSKTASMPRPEALKKDFIKHRVDYLGALPISNRSTNLAALQRPLKDLYFRYREQRNVGQSNLPGTLEINDTGLRVQYIRELHKGVQEIFNPFATIAVWAAVKFVHKRDVVPMDGSVRHRFAFLPLISDPDSQDKHRLYHELDFHEVELAADAPHPPIFACVMRRTGVPKQLECHGFVCASAEDAIIVAANLYQALLETMKKQKARRQQRMQQQRQQQQLQRQRQREEEDEDEEEEDDDEFDEEAGPPPPPSIFSDSDAGTASGTLPVRPPRRRKKSGLKGSDAGYSGPSSLVSLGRRRSVRSSTRSNKSKRTVTYDPTRRSTRQLGRTDSARKSMGRSELARKSARKTAARNKEIPPYAQPHKKLMSSEAAAGGGGDLYTKVAMPRSKSFMNVNSQYNLQELFRELKEKEGVESIDDVLKKVITPNGISFNEIKPVYRELLLKLAMTMSQDEIFERSKNIMSQEKKKAKKEDGKKGGKGSTSGNDNNSSSNTLSKLFSAFSSSKTNSMSGKKKKVDSNLGSLQNPKNKNNAILSHPVNSYSLQVPSSAKKLSSTSSLGSSTKAKVTKADISGPLPINGATKPALGSRTPAASRKPSRISSPPSSVDDAYVSCSECGGYESVCTYDGDGNCSCRVPKIPPPKEYQAGPVHSGSSGPFAAKPPSSPESGVGDQESIYSECDCESCHSDEKCYCSLRSHPGESHTLKRPSVLPEKGRPVEGTRLHVPHHHQSSSQQPPPPPPGPPPPVTRSKNNTTIIHVGNGNSTMSSTCSSCICDDSGSTATDTTCYSIQRTNYAPPNNNNDNSLLSGFESPQTAWRRNSRLAGGAPAASTSEQCYSCSDCGRAGGSRVAGAAEPDSGGSGYASNDSCPLHGGGGVGNGVSRRPPPPQSTPHSHRSRSHDVTSHVSSSHSSGCASCGSGGGNGRGRQQQHLNGKVLVLSGVDKAGKVVYHGASASNLDRIHHHGSNSNTLTHHHAHARNHHVHPPPKPPSSTASSATVLSAKKSAEIAAVFSGARINQTTDVCAGAGGGGRDSDEDSTDAAYDSRKNCRCGGGVGAGVPAAAAVNRAQFSRSNMHTSLGYFP